MLIIVGLGNPGRKFANNRHNVGFMCIDHLARRWSVRLSQRRRFAVLGQGKLEGQEVVLAKPRTFMNLSGDAIRYLLSRFGATQEELLIIYDEMDLPLGRIRIRPEGSTAGHNGMKSIISVLDSQDFARVRVGVGRPADNQDEVSYVLGAFSKEEGNLVRETVDRVAEAVAVLLTDGIQQAMNKFNQEPSS